VSARTGSKRLRPTGAQRWRAGLVGALAGTVAFSVIAASSGFAAGAEPGLGVQTTEAGEAERQRQRDHSAELARQLDPATATTEQLIAAVTVLDQQIRSQLARTVEAERDQHDAERRMAESRDALTKLQPDLRDASNRLQYQALRLYLDPEESDNSLRLMRADDFDDAERRRVFDDVVSGDSREAVERMRALRTKRDTLQADGTKARDEAEARKHERETLFQEVLAGQAAEGKLQAEWDRRIKGQSKSVDDVGNTADLDRLIADQAKKLGPAAPAPMSSNGRMIRPCPGPINDLFGYLPSRGRRHEGIDIGAATGTPIRAAQGGRVVSAGWEGAYGNAIYIDHGSGLQTHYAHLSRIQVSSGSSVSQGAVIGLSGASGNVTGPHLHFEVLRNGTRVDPANYIPL
jgi:murein DD-endopeptidase MepM/ murein hydrolase activator NlpD